MTAFPARTAPAPTASVPGLTTLLAGLAALGVAGTAGYLAGRSEPAPEVGISAISCGIPGAEGFTIPLALLSDAEARVPVLVGPVEVRGAGAPVLLRFVPPRDLDPAGILQRDGVLHLPSRLADGSVPEAITLSCRDGAIASVLYQSSDRTTAFPVAAAR